MRSVLVRNKKCSQLVRSACVLAAITLTSVRAQTSATEIVLHNFAPPLKGSNPFVGVVRDPAGNLYGTTSGGGAANAGLVYRLDASGNYRVRYAFTGGADGAYPYSGVILDSVGNLYGTTESGGAAGAGVVFKLDAAGHETVLYNFTGGTDGGYPYAGVIRDPAGNIYGTTYAGGSGR
jgi:uncharacterized repeat protein (TIGR03803 family)